MRTGIYKHTSQETAYLIEDYPYGRLRCKRRVWLEFSPKHGFRFVAQTENPKNGRWNAPHKSTYADVAACLYLDEMGHVQWVSVGGYTDATQALEFAKEFGNHCEGADRLRRFAMQKSRLSEAWAAGTAYVTINGEKQEKSEAETVRHIEESKVWLEIYNLLTEGLSHV